MTIELYAAPKPDPSGVVESPISNITGELPEQEPELELGEPMGTFPSREDAVDFIIQQLADQKQTVTDTQSAPFNAYTHVEWLTVTTQTGDQSADQRTSYYLVTDEGY